MADYGHDKTDKMLKQLERRIHSEYSNAAKEIRKKTRDYLKAFEKRDSEMLAKLNANEITQKEYLTWRATTMATGQRWEALKDTIGAELENSNAIANAMIQGHTYDVYALNHNFGAYEVEKGSLVDTSYVLYDRPTVERLVKDNPKMLPNPGKRTSEKIKRGELKRWNNREVQSVMMQSILMGDSIPDIAKRLAEKVGEANSYSHIRAARTMTTGAENAGRLDSYKRAEEMGITMRKKWMATNDDRTREAHSELDGVSVPVDEPFENEIGEIMFPGDPDADDANVYNCRCTLVADFSSEDEQRENPELADESFERWSKERK